MKLRTYMGQKWLNQMKWVRMNSHSSYEKKLYYWNRFITETFNSMIKNSDFPDLFKEADIKPVYKKNSRNEKGNYRSVSILPNLSKIYEHCMYKKKNKYFDSILCKCQFGCRMGYKVQHCLIIMIE